MPANGVPAAVVTNRKKGQNLASFRQWVDPAKLRDPTKMTKVDLKGEKHRLQGLERVDYLTDGESDVVQRYKRND
jgi:hypothetical protein